MHSAHVLTLNSPYWWGNEEPPYNRHTVAVIAHRGWALGNGILYYEGSESWEDTYPFICNAGGVPEAVRPTEAAYVPLRVYDGGGAGGYNGLEWLSVISPDGSWRLLPRSSMPDYPRADSVAMFDLGQVRYPFNPVEDAPVPHLDLAPYCGTVEGEYTPAPTVEYAIHDGIVHLYGKVRCVGPGSTGDSESWGDRAWILQSLPEEMAAVNIFTNGVEDGNLGDQVGAVIVHSESGGSWTAYIIRFTGGDHLGPILYLIINGDGVPLYQSDVRSDIITTKRHLRGDLGVVGQSPYTGDGAWGQFNHGDAWSIHAKVGLADGGKASIATCDGNYEMVTERVGTDVTIKLYREGVLIGSNAAASGLEIVQEDGLIYDSITVSAPDFYLTSEHMHVRWAGFGWNLYEQDDAPPAPGRWYVSRTGGSLVTAITMYDSSQIVAREPEDGEILILEGLFWPTLHPGVEEPLPNVIVPGTVQGGPVASGVLRHLRTVGS